MNTADKEQAAPITAPDAAQKLYESKVWRDEQNAQWHATGHQRNLTVYEMWSRAVHAAESAHEHQCSTHYFAHAKCDCAAIAGASHEL